MKTLQKFACIFSILTTGLLTQTGSVYGAAVSFSTSSTTDTNTTALNVLSNTPFTLDIYGQSVDSGFAGYSLYLDSNATGQQVALTGITAGSNFGFPAGTITLPANLSPSATDVGDAFALSNNLSANTNYLLSTDTFSISAPGTYTIFSDPSTIFSDANFASADYAPRDTITVTVTPEPSTWILMLGGCALLVGLHYRRRVSSR